ncbi:MAG TPA: ZIP family metal transporter [Candidatus Limnocylindria bacterium]|nr:ZIP family metal transporter [Candidatus Limnocylindria bacterium]
MPLAVVAILVSVSAFVSALGGGLLAMRAARSVGLLIAFGAGIRIGAAYFDLIPESVEHLGGSLDVAMLCTAVGFLAFYAIEKLTLIHVGHEAASELAHDEDHHRHLGLAGALGMTLHSLLDGIAVAAGLAVGGGLGIVIAVVVVVHRFSDGIGVVSFLVAAHSTPQEIRRWVAFVAIAPVIGVIAGLLVPVPEGILGGMLGVFAGFFLYIGAAELLPEAHRADQSRRVVMATLAGVVAIWLFSYVAGTVGGH